MMNPEEAFRLLKERFPFPGYLDEVEGTHLNIARTVLRHLPAGARILDFGSGPCDKPAMLQLLGFECSALDDLQDDWHVADGNREKIIRFARESGVDLRISDGTGFPFASEAFDMVMLHDVLEHLHDSPRDLLNDLLRFVKSSGYLFATVPNIVNIRKRVAVLFGRTNMPRFDFYYWYPGPWRGHIREYTDDDLRRMADYLNLDVTELRSCHHMIRRLARPVRPLYRAVTRLFPGWRDSWLLVARKRPDWRPVRELPRAELNKILSAATTYHY